MPLTTWPVSSPSWSAVGPCPWSRQAACQTVCWPSQWLHTWHWKIQWRFNYTEKGDFFALRRKDLLLVWTSSFRADHNFFSPTTIALQSHLDDINMEKQKTGNRHQLCFFTFFSFCISLNTLQKLPRLFYLGTAGGAWAVTAMVAGRWARMAAVRTRLYTGLPAAALAHAVAAVADPPAAVASTGQSLVASQAAGNVLQVTGDVAALLQRETTTSEPQRGRGNADESTCRASVTSCFPIHHFWVRWVQGGHFSSPWQLWSTEWDKGQSMTLEMFCFSWVATEQDGLTWVLTLVSSCADVLAFWGLCATSDGRVEDSEATVARQLIETCQANMSTVTLLHKND